MERTLTDKRLFFKLKVCHATTEPHPNSRTDTKPFIELRELSDDLIELGDTATATLVRKAIDSFAAWKFEVGERLRERALEERRKHEHEDEPPRSPYFNTYVLAIS
jgi:hypothetical protein